MMASVVGRIRSCAYGYTVARNVALATLPAALEQGTELTVDVFGDPTPGPDRARRSVRPRR